MKKLRILKRWSLIFLVLTGLLIIMHSISKLFLMTVLAIISMIISVVLLLMMAVCERKEQKRAEEEREARAFEKSCVQKYKNESEKKQGGNDGGRDL